MDVLTCIHHSISIISLMVSQHAIFPSMPHTWSELLKTTRSSWSMYLNKTPLWFEYECLSQAHMLQHCLRQLSLLGEVYGTFGMESLDAGSRSPIGEELNVANLACFLSGLFFLASYPCSSCPTLLLANIELSLPLSPLSLHSRLGTTPLQL